MGRRVKWVFALWLLGAAPLWAQKSPCASWAGGDFSKNGGCLKAVEQEDLALLSGNPSLDVGWTLEDSALAKLLRGIETGNDDALAAGLRLVLVLKGTSEEQTLRALGGAMEQTPEPFLSALQGMIDFSRSARQVPALKEYLWNSFLEDDFGYRGELAQESVELRRRGEALRAVADPALKEAREYSLKMLDAKARELSGGI